MKRTKRLTKRERKAQNPRPARASTGGQQHIHCVACGRHIDASEFSGPPASATYITCDHGSQFPACITCVIKAEQLVAAHDRSGQPIQAAPAWH